ncbi:hypothetical protein H9Q72_003821 [Fusarium xylarioides]|uniref:Ubiquitin-like domain-containing protein n=1 Tax=Fusarium xylarioides TaxID=221167 RepID=A0A9P7I2V5_9HYPO|nr:hypothetical protein H9Q70_004213 [Fusarium xylarioides]KAG5768749.1 hypothetical protein H9Q72_003821 [Fusarium xylarioides]
MDRIKGFQTFRWSLKRSEVQYKLTLIESHKTAIQLMLNILILAATTRKEAQSQVTETASTSEGKQEEPESEVPLLRQQSENLAYAASHCLVDLLENQEFDAGQPKTDPDSDDDDATRQVQIHDHGPSDETGRWLFELVFESYSGMQELVRQAFVQVEALYPQVLAGQYSLNGPEGNLIHPLRWESTVEPGMQVVMVMSIPPASYPEKSKPNPETEKVNVPTRRQEKLKSKYTKAIMFDPKRIF